MKRKNKKVQLGVPIIAPQPTRYTSIAAMNLEDSAIERKKQQAAHDARREEEIQTYYAQTGHTIMQSPVAMRDDYANLEKAEHDPDAGARFLAEMKERGIEFSMSDIQTIGKYAEAQAKHFPGVGLTLANLYRSFERMKALGCLEYTEPVPAEPAPAPTPKSLDDALASLPTDSPELRYKLAESVLGPDGEFSQMARAWHQDVLDRFGVAMTQVHHRAAWQFIQNHGRELNPMKHETYNAARRELNRLGLLDAWTVRERLDSNLRLGRIGDREYRRRIRSAELENRLDKSEKAV
jgi:hypothetical protein